MLQLPEGLIFQETECIDSRGVEDVQHLSRFKALINEHNPPTTACWQEAAWPPGHMGKGVRVWHSPVLGKAEIHSGFWVYRYPRILEQLKKKDKTLILCNFHICWRDF